ncbi:MAG: mechanosensitive ion channel family protein [Candidatus Limnocylindria bacterium]
MPAIDLPNWADIGLKIAGIAAVAIAAIAAIRIAGRVATRQLVERRASSVPAPVDLERRVGTVERLLVRILAGVVAAIAGLMVLDQFGIDIGPALAGLGVAGIAVGLGAQTLVKDWLAGIFVVLESQYSRGDLVRIAGVEGVVEDFSLRRTTLREPDGTVHTVPNGQITVATNLTYRTDAGKPDTSEPDAGDATPGDSGDGGPDTPAPTDEGA